MYLMVILMKMDVLRYFVIAARLLNFTKAAEECHIAQTAMSRAIASLENELGVVLFTRDNHNVALTAAGHVFYNDVKSILSDFDAALYNAKTTQTGIPNRIKVGYSVLERGFLTHLLTSFKERNPEIAISVVRRDFGGIWNLFLEDETIDIVFTHPVTRYELISPEFVKTPLFHIHYCVLVSEKHPLAKRGYMNAEDFAHETILSITKNEGAVNLHSFKLYSKLHKVHPLEFIQADSLDSLFIMVSLGLGVGFVPNFLKQDIPEGIVMIRQNAYPDDQYFAIHRSSNKNAALQKFLASIKQDHNYLMTLDWNSMKEFM